ncbi:amidohydrolase family protein [Lichenicoccus sp.]|uniref:amidohydrolase family protein n=1 Tax=Lichenicoccus sp. TaxID=2781899 RepID=UPI003D10FFA7
MTIPIIDAHQHFWNPDGGGYSYPWLSGPFQPIRRAFAPDDLRADLEADGISATVLVQTQNSLDETRDFLRLAEATDFVAGVVGWVDLTDPAVAETLDALRSGSGGRWLVGVRHLLHEEDDPAWILRPDARQGLEAVAAAGLAYDLVGTTAHLPAMARIVAEMPRLRFVLDHIAKPDIAAGVMEPWRSLVRQVAAHREHVWCKLSGMITEADWTRWKPSDLQPYIAHALAAFGVERCMFGTDWPVCLVAGSYRDVVAALGAALGDLDSEQHAQIMGGSAIAAYRLPQFS